MSLDIPVNGVYKTDTHSYKAILVEDTYCKECDLTFMCHECRELECEANHRQDGNFVVFKQLN